MGIEIAQIITSIAALVAALVSAAGVFVSLRNGRKVDATAAKVESAVIIAKATHEATNGLVAKLVESTKVSSHAEGVAEGIKVATDDARLGKS